MPGRTEFEGNIITSGAKLPNGDPMWAQMCDYDRENEKNIISSALKSVKVMEERLKNRSTSNQIVKS